MNMQNVLGSRTTPVFLAQTLFPSLLTAFIDCAPFTFAHCIFIEFMVINYCHLHSACFKTLLTPAITFFS